MPLSSVITVEWSPASDPFDTTPTWVDITQSVRSVEIDRGRGGVFELYGAGRATIVLNNPTGGFDPTAWYRWRQVRVTATATGPVSNVLFYGFVENIFHDQSTVPKNATATIQATDLMGVLSRYEFPASLFSITDELAGDRITRILDAAAIPSAWYSIASGYVDIVAPTQASFNSLHHIQDVAESEGGAFYCSAAGVLTFEDRYEGLSRLDSAAVTTFSDTPAGAEVPYLYGEMVLTPPGRDYRNVVTITGDSGTPQQADDITSGYPPDSLSRTLPMASDGQAGALAALLLEVYKQTGVIWPEGISVSVWPDSQNTLDEVSALDLRELCTVEFTPAGKTQQTYKVFVESISHTIGGGHWTCQLGFSSADRWEDAWGTKSDYLIISDATYGLIGTGRIGPH